MSVSLGWNKRGEDGKRIKVKFTLIQDRLTWKQQIARFEDFTTFQPEAEDWEALLDTVERNYVRGKVKPEDLKLLKRLRRESGA